MAVIKQRVRYVFVYLAQLNTQNEFALSLHLIAAYFIWRAASWETLEEIDLPMRYEGLWRRQILHEASFASYWPAGISQ